jgi:hypothetical protein
MGCFSSGEQLFHHAILSFEVMRDWYIFVYVA